MAEAPNPLTAIPRLDDTQAGNYFVSNYPPFSVWDGDHANAAEARLEDPGNSETPLGLYIHLPFCRKRCNFCYFRVYTDKNAEDIQQYLDALIEEARIVAQKAFVQGRQLDFIYFGGGTPSYLSEKQLTYLMSGLRNALPWDSPREVAFECEPGTLSEHKLEAIRDFGVNRLSLGVENFDDDILVANNRAHRSMEIYRAWGWLEKVDFAQVNLDLIAGMVGETEANWQRNIDETIRLGPEAVTIYQMEIPYNTTIYKEMKEQGANAAPVADWATKRRWVGEAFEQLEKHGHHVGSAYTAVKDSSTIRFVYRDQLWDGADMLALGVSSFGHLGGVHYQNEAHMAPYMEAVKSGRLPISRALPITSEETMIRQFVLNMKLGRLVPAKFQTRFGVDVVERWRDSLEIFEAQGMLTFSNDLIELTRDGLLQVDRLLHAFFLPQHTKIRYV